MFPPNLRPIIVSVAIWNLTAFVLIWLALLQDVHRISDCNLQERPMVTYNTSAVGRDPDGRYSAGLAARIKEVVPDDVLARDPPSVTAYLGGYDYYALYHFYICRGHYEADPDDPAVLTRDRVNETCERKPTSYVFDLAAALRADLDPSVAAPLARAEVPAGLEKFNAKASTAFLVIGLVFATLNLFLLPFAFMGSHRVSRLAAVFAFFTMVGFVVGASIDTSLARCAKDKGIGITENYFGILWAGTAHSILAVPFMIWEGFCEYWTPPGERITTYEKPKEADYKLWKRTRRTHQSLEER